MINLSIEERIFESGLLKFQVRASDPKAADLVEDSSVVHDGQQYFITEVKDAFDDKGIALKSIEAEIGWMNLANIKRVGSFEIVTQNAEVGLTQILSGTSWTAGACFTTGTFSYEGQDLTVLGLIWDWCRTVGGEPTFNTLTKTILIDASAGAFRGLSFRYGRNLKSIERVAKPPQYTRIYPYGRNELDITTSTGGVPYLEDYTWYTAQGLTLEEAQANYRKDELYSDDSIISEDALYALAQARLAISSRPTISYTAKVLNLSAISGVDEALFKTGDFATVYDEIENGVLDARIIRKIQWPNSPEKDEVELAFNNVLLPSPNSASRRANQTKNWELFVSSNTDTLRKVQLGDTLLGRIKLKTIEDAEWVIGYSIDAVAVGTSVVTIEFTDDETGLPFWATQINSLTPGQLYRFSFNLGRKEIPEGLTTLVVRATSDTAGAGLDIAAGSTNLWVLARGTTRASVTLANSITFNYTGANQFWSVPDDVTEIQVECIGSEGGPATGGYMDGRPGGGKVIAKFPVIAGTAMQAVVGGATGNAGGGWPNGGAGDAITGFTAYGGGGSSSFGIVGHTVSTALVVAGAAGGAGEQFGGAYQHGGGGGFYAGADAPILPADSPYGGYFPGYGATQLAGGAGNPGGAPGFIAGAAGTLGAGGSAGNCSNSFTFPPGGGGGGFYGGGAAGGNDSNGSGNGGGGGGGSGRVDPSGFDLEYFDNFNTDSSGSITVSWETPDV